VEEINKRGQKWSSRNTDRHATSPHESTRNKWDPLWPRISRIVISP